MADFEVIEVAFDPDDFELTLEDEFIQAKLSSELKAVTDIEQLRVGALKLLELAILRQGIIRGLVRRVASLDGEVIRMRYED